MGGTVHAIEEGCFQRAIADAAYEHAKARGSGAEVVVGVNKYVDLPTPADIDVHRTDPETEARQIAGLRRMRLRRDNNRVERLLDQLAGEAQKPSVNLMPATIELVKARASMGEIVQRLRGVFGSYVEQPVF